MKMNRLLMCVVLSVLQVDVKASGLSEEVLLLQQQVQEMQQQMATERQHMQQERAGDVELLQQQLKEMQQHVETEREELQQQVEVRLETERQKREQVEKMQQQIASEQQEMQQKMATEQQEMQQQQRQMQQKMSNLEKENTNLKQNIETINHKLANNTLENIKLSKILNELKQDLSLGFGNVSDTVNAKHNGSFIGFSAYADETREYNDGVTLLFQSVVTNVGSLYAPGTSIFTCGYEGYYLFSVSVHADTGDSMFAAIIMGATQIATVYADHTVQETGSNTVVVLCPQFTQVYVMCGANGRRMFGEPTRMDSMFTGVLLLQQ